MTSVLTGRRTAWLVALIPLLFAGALIGLLGEAERDASPTDALPRGLDSTLATELRDQLPTDDASVAIVLFSSDERISADAVAALGDTAAELGPQGRRVPAEDGPAAL
ncbi:MAG: MMPL family transporter, partial [Nocardioides sp.]